MHFRKEGRRGWCRERESNPHEPFGSSDFKSDTSASSVIPARDNSTMRKKTLPLFVKGRARVSVEVLAAYQEDAPYSCSQVQQPDHHEHRPDVRPKISQTCSSSSQGHR